MKRMYISLFGGKKNIDRCIQQLEQYKVELNNKTERLVEELSKIGIKALDAHIGTISSFYSGDLSTEVGHLRKEGDRWICEIIMSGKQCVFVEFGAGVTFNTPVGGSKHPKGQELGLTIGSYNPSSPNASNPLGWWYTDEWGKSQHTYGTPTFAPMYKSSMEMMLAIQSVAKGVF